MKRQTQEMMIRRMSGRNIIVSIPQQIIILIQYTRHHLRQYTHRHLHRYTHHHLRRVLMTGLQCPGLALLEINALTLDPVMVLCLYPGCKPRKWKFRDTTKAGALFLLGKDRRIFILTPEMSKNKASASVP